MFRINTGNRGDSSRHLQKVNMHLEMPRTFPCLLQDMALMGAEAPVPQPRGLWAAPRPPWASGPKHASSCFITPFQAGTSFFSKVSLQFLGYCLIQLVVVFLGYSTSFGKTPSQAASRC